MDKLEKHIRSNRKDLDRYDPSPDIWNRIKNSLKKRKTHVIVWRSIAAIALIIIGISTLVYYMILRELSGTKEKNSEVSILKANPQLKETEIYYNNLVNSLYQEATPMLTGRPDIKKEMLTDISHLDSICSDIKDDLKDNIANQEVIEAIIQNYRIRIRLLEDMLTLLKENEIEQKKNNSHEL